MSYGSIARPAWGDASKICHQLLADGLRAQAEFIEGRLLDVGCGSKPYRELLGARVTEWIGVDIPDPAAGRAEAEVTGSALALPFRDRVFDTVLSTQVLEHTPEPARMLAEIARVLRPGGCLVLSAPQTNPLHEEPHDFYRYTHHGLRYLAEQSGLTVMRIQPMGGNLATFLQLVAWHVNPIKRIPIVGHSLHRGVVASIAFVGLRAGGAGERLTRAGSTEVLGYVVVARRPDAPQVKRAEPASTRATGACAV